MTQTNEAKHFDFDAFMAEVEEQGPTITVFGKVEQLPASLPAIITTKTIRMMKAKKAEVQMGELIDMAYAIFGKERLDGWLKRGLSMTGLEVLLKHSIELYNKTP